ncbi:MAG: efflux transporter outer membrane subunit, partial [Rhodocyclaceae bacterium]|nr:efflux transporter outer membrane subunit [Rhodocyclaceae bacterium]
MNRRVGWALAAGLALSACAGLPDLAPRFQLVSPADLAVVDSLGPVPVSPAPAGTWWQDFADPQLDALIDEALTASPTLQMAQARVARARAVAGIAEGATRPALALAGEADRERFSKNYLLPPSLGGGYWNTARLAGEFSYGLDFWGRHKSRWQGAQAELQAARAEAQASRLMLASAISQVYGALDYQFLEADLVARLATQRQEALRLTDLRVKAGLEPESARERAAAQLAAARGLQAASTERIQGLRHQLAALLGAGPDRGLAIGRPALRPVGALTLPSRLPADLIGRRPDVAALRARVQASGKYVEAARADFYPDVNLVGFAGLQSLGLTDLFQAGSLQLGVG